MMRMEAGGAIMEAPEGQPTVVQDDNFRRIGGQVATDDNDEAAESSPLRNVSWADDATCVRGSTESTESLWKLPLSEKFEEEPSRLAVTDENIILQPPSNLTEVRPEHPVGDKSGNSEPVQDLPENEALTTMTLDSDKSLSSAVATKPQVAMQIADAKAMLDNEGGKEYDEAAEHRVILPPSMTEEMINERTKAYKESTSPEAASQLLSLPIDSLHCIASFLTPLEWANYGQTCGSASKVCREIFRRVRMHGFRCATEVITAWKLGQHADAKELAALYISSGVLIYPHSLGHSYHTICWRLRVEANDMQEKAEANAANNTPSHQPSEDEEETVPHSTPVDRFYTDRITTSRVRDPTSALSSYLEEKCLYWLGPSHGGTASSISDRWNPFTQPRAPTEHLWAPPAAGGRGGATDPLLQQSAAWMAGFRPAFASGSNRSSPLSAASSASRSLSQSEIHSPSSGTTNRTMPKINLRIHRHLLDQHLLGRSSVDDEDGTMKTPPVSLAADFFHPRLCTQSISARTASLLRSLPTSPRAGSVLGRTGSDEGHLEDRAFQAWAAEAAATVHSRLGEQALEDAEDLAELQELYNQIFEADRLAPANDTAGQNPIQSGGAVVPPPILPQPPSSPQELLNDSLDESIFSNGSLRHGEDSILNFVDLEIYSATSENLKNVVDKVDVKWQLQMRFAFYQRRLEVLLLHGDSAGYEECMLDLWDEFLPSTANIHYYDRHTAVPRISNLQQFLTRPCPKAIGIVQCEIERIRISSKNRKGVGMKNRLFPTYEYRLFIRDREHGRSNSSGSDNSSEAEEDTGVRRDTVLMVAKNRGRKPVDTEGVVSMTPASKKGANNYYLYIPQQVDVDAHFNHVNELEEESSGNINGGSLSKRAVVEKSSPVMLGRLQSNFIGTEFQIYTPRVRKSPPRKPIRRCASMGDSPSTCDEELEYDGGAVSDTGTPRTRLSRFGRLALRKNPSTSSGEQTSPLSPLSEHSPRTRNRPRQDGSGLRTPRMNRRAIANTEESTPNRESGDEEDHRPIFFEEEDGVITYTANLLGSRPRIMDVCIPRVPTDGSSVSKWRQYLESAEEADDIPQYNRMLNCFKQLQQHLDNQAADGEEEDNNDEGGRPDDIGLLALQNRPPWWNIELGSFVLNFRGRVSVASVKNFQLCDRNDHDHIMLQFGRIQGRHSFTMDYQYPLTAVQAFSIAISSLQSKISFG